MIRNTQAKESKHGSPPNSAGVVSLMTALHTNASNIINSKSQLNGPDQVLSAEDFIAIKRNGCVRLRKEEHGLGSEEPVSVPTLLKNAAANFGDVIALKAKENNVWKSWTYEEYLSDVRNIAKGFLELGLRRHHSTVILGSNSPEWILGDLGTIFAGGIAVGISNWLNPDDIAKVCIECKADIIMVENEAILEKILLIQHKLLDLKSIVLLSGEPPLSDKRKLHRSHKKMIVSWSHVMEIGKSLHKDRLEDRLTRVAINQCCTVLYTSGTDDTSKGVMLSHDNLTWSSRTALGILRAPGFNPIPSPGEETVLSVLPFHSISSQIIDVYYTIQVAGTLCICSDQDLLAESKNFFKAVCEVSPTVLFAPAEIYERIYQKLESIKLNKLSKLALDWSSGTMKDKYLPKTGNSTILPSNKKINRWQTTLAKNTVCKKYKEMLGFSPKCVFFSRGSPMTMELLKFLAGYDILVHETFGQTENCGLLSSNIPKRFCMLGTTGKAVPGVKVKILPSDADTPLTEGVEGDVGEIVCWGRNVFMGYLNKGMETNDVVNQSDHYLHLNDLAYVNDEGCNVIVGKSAYFLTLLSGEIISPFRIEQLIRMELPCVKQVIVLGHKQEYAAAILALETIVDQAKCKPTTVLTEAAQAWFKRFDFEVQTIADVIEALPHGLHDLIQAGISKINTVFKHYPGRQIKEWKILHSTFTYCGGEIGLNGKLKRNVIMEKRRSCIQAIYTNKNDPDSCSSGVAKPNINIELTPYSLTQIVEEEENKNSSKIRSREEEYKLRIKIENEFEKENTHTDALILNSSPGISVLHEKVLRT